jgi:hypothetical protein
MKSGAFQFAGKIIIALALALTMAGSPPTALAATGPLCYVDVNALGLNNGNSWTDAYTSLQSALTDPNCSEVWVAKGVYKPGAAGNQAASFTLPPGMAVYGGFAGGETARGQRLPSTNVTILSGDIDSNDTNADGNFIAEIYTDIQGSNSFHVVTILGIPGPANVLDGFTVTAGKANGPGGALADRGGGLFCIGNGAGLICSPTIANVIFSGNLAMNQGGGMFNTGAGGGQSSPILTNVAFNGNAAGYGGGMYNDAAAGGTSSPTLTDVTFYINFVDFDGGGIYNNAMPGGLSSPSLLNVTFEANMAGAGGGGMYNNGSMGGVASSVLNNVTFFANIAMNGGGMYNNGNSGTSIPIINNVTFMLNQGLATGGAMYNDAMTGGALIPNINNTILWMDMGGPALPNEMFNVGTATPTVVYSVVMGTCIAIPGNICGAGNLATDPKLGSLANYGGRTKTIPLLATSSAEDTAGPGCPTNDQRGVSRPRGFGCDIGAYERRSAPRADFDGDTLGDIGYFNPATGLWGILSSLQSFSYGSPMWFNWGGVNDIVTPGDYDGDDLLDPTVRTPPAGGQSAAYLMLLSSTSYNPAQSLVIPAGWPGLNDTPVIGDFNGDGISDPAIWRGNTGVWIIPMSPNFNTYAFYAWGTPTDKPVAADVDGDNISDIGYWRPSTGVWGFLQSSQGFSYGSPLYFNWGGATDKPVMADYDGDLLADPAVVIPPAGGQSQAYRIILSSLSYNPAQSMTVPAGWPGLNDTPVPSDYDGDGKVDAAIWRGNTGVWIIPRSSTNNTSYMFAAWGASGYQVAR